MFVTLNRKPIRVTMLIVHAACIGLVGGNGFIYLRIVLRKTEVIFFCLKPSFGDSGAMLGAKGFWKMPRIMLGQWVESSMPGEIFPRVQSHLLKVRIDLDLLGIQCQEFSFLINAICKLNSCNSL